MADTQTKNTNDGKRSADGSIPISVRSTDSAAPPSANQADREQEWEAQLRTARNKSQQSGMATPGQSQGGGSRRSPVTSPPRLPATNSQDGQMRDGETEQEWSNQLRKDRVQELHQRQRTQAYSKKTATALGNLETNVSSEELGKFKNALSRKDPRNALRHGRNIISKLESSRMSMSSAVFAFSLFLAFVKDTVDVVSLFVSVGLLGSAINLVATGIYAATLYMQGTSLKRSAIWRRYVRRFVITALAEFIPGLNFLPLWGIATVFAHLEAKKNDQSVDASRHKMKTQLSYIKRHART